MTPTTLTVLKAWEQRAFQYEHERLGQSLFNSLLYTWPAIAEELRGQPFDPFHDDRRIPAALSFIEARVVAESWRQVEDFGDGAEDYG